MSAQETGRLNTSALTAGRVLDVGLVFTLLVCLGIVLLGVWLTRFEIATPPAEDSGFFYEWKLANPDFWTRATPWLGFMAHQLAIWFTNLDYKQRHQDLILHKRYSPEDYPKYDNYYAINVD